MRLLIALLIGFSIGPPSRHLRCAGGSVHWRWCYGVRVVRRGDAPLRARPVARGLSRRMVSVGEFAK